MKQRSSNLKWIVLIVAMGILVGGGWHIWNQEAGNETAIKPDLTNIAVSTPISGQNQLEQKPETSPALDNEPSPIKIPASTNNALISTTNAASPVTLVDWELRLQQLLDSDLSDREIGEHILALWPFLALSNQVEAAEYMVEFTPDESYASVVPILTNPQTQGDVVDEFMTDLLNRSETMQLPLLLDIMKTEGHPRQETAKDYLELYVEEDYGLNWAGWEQAIQQYLKENPDF